MSAENTPPIAPPNSDQVFGRRYRAIPCPCELTTLALEQTVHMGLPPAYVYELHVAPNLATFARALIQNELTRTGPFQPVVNLFIDTDLDNHEWYVKSGDVAIGSKAW